MTRLLRARPFLWGLALLAAAAYSALAMEVDAGLRFFLPEDGSENHAAQLLRGLSDSGLAKRIVLSIRAPSEGAAVRAWHDMAGALRGAPVDVLDSEATEALGRALFTAREGFLSEQPEQELPALFAPAGVRARVEALKRSLGSDVGPIARATAPQDPLQLFEIHAQRMATLGEHSRLRRQEGALLVDEQGGVYAILLLAAHEGAFDGQGQKALMQSVTRAFAAINGRTGGALELEVAALERFATEMEQRIRGDVQRITLLSTVALVLLFVLVLGRVRFLVLGVVPLAAALAVACAVCLLVNGRIHAMTFAFGAALIGVCVDYPIHLFAERLAGSTEGDSSQAPSSMVHRALAMGCATTVLGLAAIGLSKLQGMREIALFGCSGVVSAWLTTIWILPRMMGRASRAARPLHAAALAQRAAELWTGRRWPSLGLIAAVALVVAAGAGKVRFADDPQVLTAIDPRFQAEEGRVRARAFGQEQAQGGPLVVVHSDTDLQSALQRNDALARVLDRAAEAGVIGGYRSLHHLLWSEALQRRNLAAVRANLKVQDVDAALREAGFMPEAFAPFFEAHRAGVERQSVIRPADLPAGVQRSLLAPWIMEVGGKPAVLNLLLGPVNAPALRRRLKGLDGVELIDTAGLRERVYSAFRVETLQLTGIGLLAVLATLWLRYRKPRVAIAALLPALLAATGTIGALTLLGLDINLMHLMGLLLVLSMGADYGIFLVEPGICAPGSRAPGSTYLAISMSCASTCLSFGLLGLSGVPALAAVGHSVALGVALAWLLAPAITASRKESPSHA